MKKIILFIIIAALVLPGAACAKKPAAGNDPSAADTSSAANSVGAGNESSAASTANTSVAVGSASTAGTGEQQTGEDIETGNTTIHEGGKKIESDEITAFSLSYDLDGFYEEESERYGICRSGSYRIEMKADEKGNALCSLNYREDYGAEPIQLDFTAGPEAFAQLQQVLSDAGILAINGFYGWDSALGTYVDLDAEYATGEKLSVYGEGGASASPPADIDAVIVYFNELAEQNGLRFTHLPGKRELTALFEEWLAEVLPSDIDYEDEAVIWEYEEYDDIADIAAGGNLPDGDQMWNAYARFDRQSGTRRSGYYCYSGICEKDEMMNGFLAWIRENCPDAEERDGETILTFVNFKGSIDSLQMIASDPQENELWEIYAEFDREERTVSQIEYYRITENGEEEKTVFDETLHL